MHSLSGASVRPFAAKSKQLKSDASCYECQLWSIGVLGMQKDVLHETFMASLQDTVKQYQAPLIVKRETLQKCS